MATTLAFGEQGQYVGALQSALKAHGYAPEAPSGPNGASSEFGPLTVQAVKNFQTDHGLPVTGEVDATMASQLGISLPIQASALRDALYAASLGVVTFRVPLAIGAAALAGWWFFLRKKRG